MTKPIFSLFACLALVQIAFAQQYPLRVRTDSLRFKVVTQGNRLAVDWLDRPASGSKKGELATLNGLRLDDADLVLDYQPERLRKDFLLVLGLQLRPDDGGDIYQPAKEETMEQELPTGKQITLLDGTERILEYGKTYTLIVRKTLMGPVPCDKARPAFTTARQLPYYGVAVAGGTLVGMGLVFQARRNDLYRQYEKDWKNGEVLSDDIRQRFEDAKSFDKKAKICAWSGIGVLALDGWFFSKHWWRIRQKQKIYDEFCPKKPLEIGFSPVLQSGQEGLVSGAGIRLRF